MNAIRTTFVAAAAVLSLGMGAAYADDALHNGGYAQSVGTMQAAQNQPASVLAIPQPARADSCNYQVAVWDADAKVLREQTVNGCAK